MIIPFIITNVDSSGYKYFWIDEPSYNVNREPNLDLRYASLI